MRAHPVHNKHLAFFGLTALATAALAVACSSSGNPTPPTTSSTGSPTTTTSTSSGTGGHTSSTGTAGSSTATGTGGSSTATGTGGSSTATGTGGAGGSAPSCVSDGGATGCFSCPPTTNPQFLNQCPPTGDQCTPFDNASRLPFYDGGALPSVP